MFSWNWSSHEKYALETWNNHENLKWISLYQMKENNAFETCDTGNKGLSGIKTGVGGSDEGLWTTCVEHLRLATDVCICIRDVNVHRESVSLPWDTAPPAPSTPRACPHWGGGVSESLFSLPGDDGFAWERKKRRRPAPSSPLSPICCKEPVDLGKRGCRSPSSPGTWRSGDIASGWENRD